MRWCPPPCRQLPDTALNPERCTRSQVARLSGALPLDALVLPTQLAVDLAHRRGRPRIGRGGRLIFDRCLRCISSYPTNTTFSGRAATLRIPDAVTSPVPNTPCSFLCRNMRVLHNKYSLLMVPPSALYPCESKVLYLALRSVHMEARPP